jgi:hypothetical protein
MKLPTHLIQTKLNCYHPVNLTQPYYGSPDRNHRPENNKPGFRRLAATIHKAQSSEPCGMTLQIYDALWA